MSTSFLTQGQFVVYMCPNIIFQILLLHSRPMMSHHVTCHVTAISHASSLSLKRKRNIKSRKIDKRKRKMLVSKAFYNTFKNWNNKYAVLIRITQQYSKLASIINLWIIQGVKSLGDVYPIVSQSNCLGI